MKKIGVLLCLVALTTGAFASTTNEPAKTEEQVRFERVVINLNGNESHICQYIVQNLADAMRDMTDEEAAPLAQGYLKYQINGTPMLQFIQEIVAHDGNYQRRIEEIDEELEQMTQDEYDGEEGKELRHERQKLFGELRLQWHYTAFYDLETFANRVEALTK